MPARYIVSQGNNTITYALVCSATHDSDSIARIPKEILKLSCLKYNAVRDQDHISAVIIREAASNNYAANTQELILTAAGLAQTAKVIVFVTETPDNFPFKDISPISNVPILVITPNSDPEKIAEVITDICYKSFDEKIPNLDKIIFLPPSNTNFLSIANATKAISHLRDIGIFGGQGPAAGIDYLTELLIPKDYNRAVLPSILACNSCGVPSVTVPLAEPHSDHIYPLPTMIAEVLRMHNINPEHFNFDKLARDLERDGRKQDIIAGKFHIRSYFSNELIAYFDHTEQGSLEATNKFKYFLMACNTAHYWQEPIKRLLEAIDVRTKFISTPEAGLAQVNENETALILCSRGSNFGQVFHKAASKLGVENRLIIPDVDSDLQDGIYASIQMVKAGNYPQAAQTFCAAVEKYLNGELPIKPTTLILGCTELPIIAKEIKRQDGVEHWIFKDFKIIDNAEAVASVVMADLHKGQRSDQGLYVSRARRGGSFTLHNIKADYCKVAVISDLHKYSGVSDFSKGDNPFFGIYYALYKERKLGEIDKSFTELSNKKRREIEREVRNAFTREQIAEQIDARLTPSQKKKLERDYDPKSTWERRQEVFESFKNISHVVFNGDIFDIECSKNPEEKIDEAVQWLKDRMDEAPNTKFHFVLGNHESFIKFIKAMHKLERDPHYGKQFYFHEHYFQLNDSLFVHGDEYLGIAKYVRAFNSASKMDGATAENIPPIDVESNEGHRRRELKELKHVARTAYEWFNAAYHKSQNAWRGLQNIISTLYEKIEKSDTEGVSRAFGESVHIFSGHTHEPYTVHYKDKYFYNTGAPIESKFCEFRPLYIQMENGITTHVEPLLQKDRNKIFQRPMVYLQEPSKKYCVISDIHMFANRISRYDSDPLVKEAIDNTIQEADIVVLNGDFFELFYTEDVQKAIDQSLQWLRKLAEKYPQKEIHFVLGNHEAVDLFINAVKEMAQESSNFFFHEHAFQPNEKTVFLHGDEVISGKFKQRNIYTIDTARASDMVQHVNHKWERGAMSFVQMMRHPAAVAKNILQAISKMPEISRAEQVENLFIGHTHVPFIDYGLDHSWVTNTGGVTNHAKFAGVSFDMAANGTITTPRIIDIPVDMGVVGVPYFSQR